MHRHFILRFVVAAALLMPLLARATARADDVSISSAPVVTIHSTGGTIHIVQGDASAVHVQPGLSAQRINVSRFTPDRFTNTQIMLPPRLVRVRYGRGYRTFFQPAHQFSLPLGRFGSEGVNIENPGGDMSVAVPPRVGAIFINADQGDVAVDKLRGPFIIQASRGNVRLRNAAGSGLIRTTSGKVRLFGVGGDVRIVTVSGDVTVMGSTAEKANVQTDTGAITYRFARAGTGAYAFKSGQGTIHLQFLPGVAAQVDAQTTGGVVTNLLPGAPAAASPQRAMSLPINGGGPEITATSMQGDIVIEQVMPGQSP